MNRSRREIEALALDVLRDHDMLDMAVDPVKLANAMGIKVFNAKFGKDNISGMVARRSDQTQILVDANERPQRKRFTVAHELGHHLLHLYSEDGEFIDDEDNFRTPTEPGIWTKKRTQEWEANAFAAALLMPEPLVRKLSGEISDLEGIAEWFQVSSEAMAIRLNTLGIRK